MQSRGTLFASLVLLLCVQTFAYRHLATYVNYDHVLDYNPDTGKIRAFDFRRFLTTNNTCDFFVYPPLIQESSLIDVVFTEIDHSKAKLAFLGQELFLIQSPETGSYMIRRCSGFMPQQTIIPCEVHAAGKSDVLKEPHRFFYGSENRAIRYNPETKILDLLFFDADVHGGGFPFSKPLVTGHFPSFTGEVEFAVVEIAQPKLKLLVAQEVKTGAFKVWKYSPLADTIENVLGQLVLSGTLVPGFHIKTLGENLLIAYHELSGDFEIWKVVLDGNKLAIETIKRDNLELGHGCIFDDRQACISHSTCGWCADSVTCHQLSNNRSACDGAPCRDMVDGSSPDRKKFQTFEMPLPSMLREFGDAPGENLTSPLRNLSLKSAIPLTRTSDLQLEKIEHNMTINPSEGLVFIPPSEEHKDSLKYMDSTDEILVVFENITTQETFMNTAEGKKPEDIVTSPSGEVHDQRDPGFETLPVPTAVKDITRKSFTSTPETPDAPSTEWKVPEGVKRNETEKFKPNDLPSLREDDLMNEVESRYSSLLAKGDNMKIVRPFDSKLIPESSLTDVNFHPKDTAKEFVITPEPANNWAPTSLYTSANMELGAPQNAPIKLDGSTQYLAMENARYTSISILTPPTTPPIEVTMENMHDTTGKDSIPDSFLPVKHDEKIVEGWDLPDVPVDLGQEVIGSAANGLLTATDRKSLGAKASVAKSIMIDGDALLVAPARKTAVSSTTTTTKA